MRSSTASAAASAPSSSGAVEAPVQTPTLNRSPRAVASVIRLTSAPGTTFGYPAPVSPLIPILAPGWISAAASSADITLLSRDVARTRVVFVMPSPSFLVGHLRCPQVGAEDLVSDARIRHVPGQQVDRTCRMNGNGPQVKTWMSG